MVNFDSEQNESRSVPTRSDVALKAIEYLTVNQLTLERGLQEQLTDSEFGCQMGRPSGRIVLA